MKKLVCLRGMRTIVVKLHLQLKTCLAWSTMWIGFTGSFIEQCPLLFLVTLNLKFYHLNDEHFIEMCCTNIMQHLAHFTMSWFKHFLMHFVAWFIMSHATHVCLFLTREVFLGSDCWPFSHNRSIQNLLPGSLYLLKYQENLSLFALTVQYYVCFRQLRLHIGWINFV